MFRLFFLCLLIASCQATENKQQYVRVPQSLLSTLGHEFSRDSKIDDVYAFGYMNDSTVRKYSDITVLDEERLSHINFDPKTLEDRDTELAIVAVEDYHHYDALTTELRSLESTTPILVTMKSAGKSVKGRDLWYLVLTNKDRDIVKPRTLFIANMHGDETVGRELMVYLARHLLTQYGKEQRITNILDNTEVYLMPSMNPDGFENSRRGNANGVDLNRDFPDFSSDPSDTVNGRAIETADVMNFHGDMMFNLALNFHGGAVVFNIPWDTTPNSNGKKFGDDTIIKALARNYADLNPSMAQEDGGSFDRGVTYGYEWYEVDGGMQDWSCYYRNAIHATVELSNAKYPSASSLVGYWNENKEAMIKFLEAALMGIHLQVFGPTDGIKVEVAGLRPLTYKTSTIHRTTLAGQQTITISAQGFKTTTITLPATAFDGSFQQVVLDKK